MSFSLAGTIPEDFPTIRQYSGNVMGMVTDPGVRMRDGYPKAYEDMDETSRAILAEYMKQKEFMRQQEQNKQIGRVGAKSVLGEGMRAET